MSRIAAVDIQRFNLPLAEVLSDAKHGDHTHFELITATVRLEDGSEGTGYTYTGGRGGRAIEALLVHDLAPFVTGRDAADVEAVYDAMQWHVHYVARGGIASFAISAIDIALWDLRCKAAGRPLWQMAGGASDRCRAYAGGIDLNFPLPKLIAQTQGYLERGFNAVKIKVGQPELDTDVARVRAVREYIGPDIFFAVDANYALSTRPLPPPRPFSPMTCCGSKSRPFLTIIMAMAESPMPPACLWRWARTCTPFMNSIMPLPMPSCPTFSRTRRTVAG